MAATTTRMLLLGAVALFGPVNGYQIRRELMSWRVDEWANIKPGSIYHGLSALADRGLLVRHDLVDGGRAVAVYELADAGHAELLRQLEASIVRTTVFGRDDFQTAFGMAPLLGAERILPLLRRRRTSLAEQIAALRDAETPHDHVPPHAIRGMELWLAGAETELAWLDRVIADVASGELEIDPVSWTPPADDPSHQMTADRERYLRLLGR